MNDNNNPFGQPVSQPADQPLESANPFGRPTNDFAQPTQPVTPAFGQPMPQQPVQPGMDIAAPQSTQSSAVFPNMANTAEQPIGGAGDPQTGFGNNPYMNPMPSVPAPNLTTPTEPKKKTGLIIGIVTLVAVLLVGGGVALFLLMGKVSEKDYKVAKDRLQTMVDQLDDTGSSLKKLALNADDLSSEDIDEIVEQVDGIESNVKTAIDEVGKMKAVTKDKKAADLYAKAKETSTGYLEIVGVLKEIYSDDGLRPVMEASLKLGDTANMLQNLSTKEDYVTAFQTLGKMYQDLADAASKAKISDEDIQESTTKLGKSCATIANVYKQMGVAMQNGDMNSYNTISKQAQSSAVTLVNDLSKFQSSIKKLVANNPKEYEFTNAINKLGRYLTDGANGKIEK